MRFPAARLVLPRFAENIVVVIAGDA